jgi:hypothetical protein
LLVGSQPSPFSWHQQAWGVGRQELRCSRCLGPRAPMLGRFLSMRFGWPGHLESCRPVARVPTAFSFYRAHHRCAPRRVTEDGVWAGLFNMSVYIYKYRHYAHKGA